MNIRAELHCYHCGYIAGRLEGESEGNVTRARIVQPEAGPGVTRTPGGTPRCGRCGGPVFVDDIQTVRYPPTVIVPLPAGRRRRGRPPKVLAAS